ncbi:hypothetical protein QMO14_17450 [Variovorax sp. CAN2819]|uniref:hypothetical protein n=1 Tax=Variovorax sp. CAN15 TaxID=3046727 RepID=UPI0026497C08|nr:hypothetical protein [Variovorax sp. CAN15]MDN6885383.1 hypothetical protein [Variovorax sp. CAN15]
MNLQATTTITLWQAIDALAAQLPFSTQKVGRTLSTTLSDTHAEGGAVFQFFEGTPVRLADGAELARIDLRIKREDASRGFLVLELKGRCVPLAEVRQHYAALDITDVPRGRSLDEATTFTAMPGWGRLSFGFTERNPDCLAFVAFDPA